MRIPAISAAAAGFLLGLGLSAASAETCMIKDQIPVPCSNFAPVGPNHGGPVYRGPVYRAPAPVYRRAPVYQVYRDDYYDGDYGYYDDYEDYGNYYPYRRHYRGGPYYGGPYYGGYYGGPTITFGFGFGGGYGYWGY
jgi:hypothetical protein